MKKKHIAFLFYFTLFALFCLEFILNLTPPNVRDEIIHHLAIPKLWLKHGKFYETPWADFSYYPMYINLLYLIPLYFKNDILPKFIHMAFGLGSGWLIYLYLKKRYDAVWGLLGFAIFLSTPIVIWLSTSAYIDLGMTFFTTASVLGLVQWRDSGYKKHLWLVISAVSMGIAVGSKYNALIAWFILNLIMIILYVRDENSQGKALKYGVLFFMVAAVVASPWYIKNFMLTGNPFYPLFNSFFTSLHNHQPATEIVRQGFEKSSGGVGFFKLRGYMYGESFWETLAIPIRMFFQGEDNSYQYFQGRLNPILIVFLPFIFFDRKHGKDKFFFLTFSFCFIFLAFFLTEKQVRYILPTIPLLTLLAVMGIKTLYDRIEDTGMRFARGIKVGLLLTVAILLVPNGEYLRQHFLKIDPLPYVLGKETRDAFLKRHLLDYEAVQFVNANLPADAIVYTVFLGRRGYYLEREYRNDPSFGTNLIGGLVRSSVNDKKFLNNVKSLGVTHILMRTDLTDRFLQQNFSKEEIERFLRVVKKHWKMLYSKDGFAVWEIT